MACVVIVVIGLYITAVYGGHSLHYYTSMTSARYSGLPQFSITVYLDGIPCGRYNSDTRQAKSLIPNLNMLSGHLEELTRYARTFEMVQGHRMKFLMRALNKTSIKPNVKISESISDRGLRLHCLVYGFYPRDVEVKWINNGRDEVYSEEQPQILPNTDGTFQIRVSVQVEEGDSYSCHVDHSSLDNVLVVPYEPGKGPVSHYIVPVSVAALLLTVILGMIIYRRSLGICFSY
ncbi:hypothetical protein GDO86_016643 [Hymenochirus boettgeri]|uniref:Ig-like domain-containing protein n=1 Tax=Hymenochirus boettgeri TaxID=247094 RepID=A0A8T2K2N6_9PIPI|nr:hypothetical protein GDO86_016643 [Hymenochirus boettgeri]